MAFLGLQLRLWCPKFREFRTLEFVGLFDQIEGAPIGWETFWHGDVDSTTFDMAGREIKGKRHMNDLFHEVGCVVPSTFITDLEYVYDDKQGEQVASLINELTRLRTEQFGAIK